MLNSNTSSLSEFSSVTVSEFDCGQQFSLKNGNGMEVRLADYGATITSIRVPDRDGNIADVVQGYDSIEAYKTAISHPYFGSTLGRNAGRIANGQFTLDGVEYRLACNNGPNHLHGGNIGFDRVVWSAKSLGNGICFSYYSCEGEEGYPGNLDATVVFTLNDASALLIDYRATTDKACPINFSNHSYFNLAGEDVATVLDHELSINADCMTAIDKHSIPTGEIISVAGTPFDFRKPKCVGRDLGEENEQLLLGGGYDHNFILNNNGEVSPVLAATLREPGSGRYMEVLTTAPGVQFYSANHLDGTLVGKSGKPYVRRSSLCLETQHFPDSPNKPDFPSTILRPGEIYKSQTIYRFSVR